MCMRVTKYSIFDSWFNCSIDILECSSNCFCKIKYDDDLSKEQNIYFNIWKMLFNTKLFLDSMAISWNKVFTYQS